MTDPVISPDGKWMWTGSEWIPAPPTSAPTADSTINLEDSMMSGNVNLEQNSSDASSVINLKDSAMSGDINITQNNPEDIATAMVQALERMGFSGQSSPEELTPSQEKEVEQVLEMSEQLAGHGVEIDPWTEITLGNAAFLAGRTHSAQQHCLRALETFRKNTERYGEASALTGLGNIAQTRGDLAEAERLQRESLAIKREIGDRQGEADSLHNLGTIMNLKGQYDEERRMYTEAVRIRREIGIPIDQWFIDNGY
jgi:tetratricopeptide (TPR) repeat protein